MLAEGFRNSGLKALGELLGHADQRIRLAAQFELARRGAVEVFTTALEANNSLLSRLHAMWGLEQIARTQSQPDVVQPIVGLLTDEQEEIRTHAARILGDRGIAAAEHALIDRLGDSSSRVRAATALSLGKLKSLASLASLVSLLAENDDRDPVLRHAGIMGLCGVAPEAIVEATLNHQSVAVRRAAAVALRRLQSPLAAKFLDDENVLVAEEAARAIHDVPIPEAARELASQYDRFPQSIAFTHRAMNANYRIGDEAASQRLVAIAIDDRFDSLLRGEALEMLSHWSAPSSRDRVLGMWRPISPRGGESAAKALADQLAKILATGDERLIDVALQSVGSLRIVDAAKVVEELLVDNSKSNKLRARAMSTLGSLNPSDLAQIAKQALGDDACEVRIAARKAYVAAVPILAGESVFDALTATDLRERQSANGLIVDLPKPIAELMAIAQLDRLLQGEIPSDTRLDVVECAKHFVTNNSEVAAKLAEYERGAGTDPPAAFRDCLEGGDAENGKSIFFQRLQVSCLRCHRIGDQGGAVGPELSEIGAKKDRQYLLDAIVDPNKAIAEKFETVVILNDLGKTLSGFLQAETNDFLRLTTAEGNLITINKSSIDERRNGKSAMPDDVSKHLTPKEVRDLVEFLASQAPPNGTNNTETAPLKSADANGANDK